MELKITDEQIAEAKKVHKTVYAATLKWEDEECAAHSVELLFRAPTVADIEAYSRTVVSEPVVSNRNLLLTVLLEPGWNTLKDLLESKSAVIHAFVEKELSPFFGTKIYTASRKV